MLSINKKMVFATTLAVMAYIISCTQDPSVLTTKNTTDNEYNSDVINNPDKFAWNLFIEISKPADPNDPGSEIVWQKEWANAEDVFDDPMNKPEWSKIVGLPLLRDKTKGAPLQQEVFNQMLVRMKLSAAQIKSLHSLSSCKDKMPPDSLIRNETKMNKAAFDFIVENNMYYAEGVEDLYNRKIKIDAPIEAREIKAIWKPIKPEDKPKYHFVEKRNEIYGLVALHIITKDLPNWTWATFEHNDNECLTDAENDPKLRSIDRYGKNADGTISKELKGDFAKNGMPDKWLNYRLRGTQTDFTSPTGEKIILGNTYTESGFESTSSCITCHSKATVGPKLAREQMPPGLKEKDIPDYFNHLDIFETREPAPIGNLGTPDPTWFYNYLPSNRKEVKYIQTDFMWSIPFRVKRQVKYPVQ